MSNPKHQPVSEKQGSSLLQAASATAIPLFAATVIGTYLLDQQRRERDKHKANDELRAALEAQNPIIRVDPVTTDTALEQRLNEAGLPEEGVAKTAQLHPVPLPTKAADPLDVIGAGAAGLGRAVVGTVKGIAGGAESASESLAKGLGIDKWFPGPKWVGPPTLAALLLAATYGGHRLVKARQNEDANSDLDEELAQETNDYQALVADMMHRKGLLRQRPLSKLASGEQDPKVLAGIYGLYALGVGGLSTMLAKRYFDSNDKSRKDMEALKLALGRMGIQDNPPVFMEVDDSLYPEGAPTGTARKRTVVPMPASQKPVQRID